jgi:hypothetical protein
MGIHLDIFAVDLQPFEEFVNQTVWDGLCFVAEHGYPDRRRGFDVYAELPPDPPEDDMFFAIPTVGVITRSRRPLNRDSDPVFQRRLRDCFNEERGSFLKFMVALASSDAIPFVTDLTGSKRWWIGSLLNWAEQASHVTHDDYTRLGSILTQMLGQWNSGHDDAEFPPIKTTIEFPILPCGDLDQEMTVIDESDAKYLAHFLRTEVPEDESVFRGVTLYPNNTRAEWDEWVRLIISCVMKIDDLSYNQLRLVSIIG